MNKPLSLFANGIGFDTELMLNIDLNSDSGKQLLKQLMHSNLDSISILLPLNEALKCLPALDIDSLQTKNDTAIEDRSNEPKHNSPIPVIHVNSMNNTRLDLLTDREEQIFELITKGSSNKQIARDLDICEGTVKVHVKNLLRKLNAKNRIEAAMKGLNNNLKENIC